MSWTVRLEGPRSTPWPEPSYGDYAKEEQKEQFVSVRKAVAELLNVIGLKSEDVIVNVSAHANEGHAPSDSWADESITITVTTKGKNK